MPDQDFRHGRAKGDCGLDIGFLARGQNNRADQPDDARDFGDGDGGNDRPHGWTVQRHQCDGQQDRRDRHQRVHHPHDDRIGGAEESRDHADHQPQQDRHDGGGKTDDQGQLAPDQHPAEDVAAEIVGAKRVAFDRAFQAHHRVHGQGIMWRDPLRQQRQHHDDGQHHGGDLAAPSELRQPQRAKNRLHGRGRRRNGGHQ